MSDVGRDLPTLDLASAEPLLRRLELTVRNKLDGLLQGNYLGLVPGPGSEAGESRLYVPGDDVRRMDWPVTARTLVPHVRQTIADRELETWLVVDLSPSMDFGTALTEKRELVLAAITAVVHLTVARRQPGRCGRDDRRGDLPNPGAVGPRARPAPDPQDRADAPGEFRRARRPGRGSRAAAPAAAPPRAGRGDLRLPGLLRRRPTARSSAPTGNVRCARCLGATRSSGSRSSTRGSSSCPRPGW